MRVVLPLKILVIEDLEESIDLVSSHSLLTILYGNLPVIISVFIFFISVMMNNPLIITLRLPKLLPLESALFA